MSQVLHKMFGGVRRPLVLLVFTSSLVTLTFGQEDCDRYCHDDCSAYFPNSQFSECVRANVHCNCTTKFSTGNPFMWFVVVVIVFLSIAACCACRGKCNRGSIPAHSVVAQPVVSTTASSYNNGIIMANSRGYAPRAPPSTFIAASPVTATPQKPSQISQEYLPPPAYFDVVNDSVCTSTTANEQCKSNEY